MSDKLTRRDFLKLGVVAAAAKAAEACGLLPGSGSGLTGDGLVGTAEANVAATAVKDVVQGTPAPPEGMEVAQDNAVKAALRIAINVEFGGENFSVTGSGFVVGINRETRMLQVALPAHDPSQVRRLDDNKLLLMQLVGQGGEAWVDFGDRPSVVEVLHDNDIAVMAIFLTPDEINALGVEAIGVGKPSEQLESGKLLAVGREGVYEAENPGNFHVQMLSSVLDESGEPLSGENDFGRWVGFGGDTSPGGSGSVVVDASGKAVGMITVLTVDSAGKPIVGVTKLDGLTDMMGRVKQEFDLKIEVLEKINRSMAIVRFPETLLDGSLGEGDLISGVIIGVGEGRFVMLTAGEPVSKSQVALQRQGSNEFVVMENTGVVEEIWGSGATHLVGINWEAGKYQGLEFGEGESVMRVFMDETGKLVRQFDLSRAIPESVGQGVYFDVNIEGKLVGIGNFDSGELSVLDLEEVKGKVEGRVLR